MNEAKSTQKNSASIAPGTSEHLDQANTSTAAVEGSPQLQGSARTSGSSSRKSKSNTLESNTNQTKANGESTIGPADVKRQASRLQLAPASADERDSSKASSHVGAVRQPLDKAALGVATKSKELEIPSIAMASAEVEVAIAIP